MASSNLRGKWKLIKQLTQGGQGLVHIAENIENIDGKQYILKELINKDNPQRILRFRREINTTNNLSHNHILKVIDFNIETDKPYLVTEYCAGGSLQKTQNRFWANAPLLTLEIFQQICEGVAEAHNKGIIHRDIKPDNIFLRTDSGPAVIGDFGICFLIDEADRLTMLQEAVGPKLYMAPEVEDGKILMENLTKKCDIYSLGKVLYWLFAGRIFSREKHREPNWDLRTICNNHKMEYVNRLLDKMITYNARSRISIDDVLREISTIRRLIEGKFNMIQKGTPQNCIYCGIGEYKDPAKTTDDTKKQYGLAFGMSESYIGNKQFRALCCDNCGNIQFFRVDESKNKNWLD